MEILFPSKLEIGKECCIGIGHKPEVGVRVYFVYVYLLEEMRKTHFKEGGHSDYLISSSSLTLLIVSVLASF